VVEIEGKCCRRGREIEREKQRGRKEESIEERKEERGGLEV